MNEVIIDGCNVAECIELHINERYAENCNLTNCPCRQNPNCYFKQLQRAKAELEQYKKSKQASYEVMQEQWNKAVNELRDLKAYKNIMTDSAINLQLSNMQNEINKLYAENEKLKERLKNYVN